MNTLAEPVPAGTRQGMASQHSGHLDDPGQMAWVARLVRAGPAA